jgi:hypothetical protein
MPPTSINRANTVLKIDFKNVFFIFFSSETLEFRRFLLLPMCVWYLVAAALKT